jgi:hypothetical protein
MTPTEQPKEYIITEKKIQDLNSAINIFYAEDHPDLWDDVYSRPVNTVAQPEHDCLCVAGCDPKNCNTPYCKCSECWNPATSLGCDGNWKQAHDAAVAEKARQNEAIRWMTAFNTLISTESKRHDKESVDMVYSYRVAQVIDALRHNVEP